MLLIALTPQDHRRDCDSGAKNRKHGSRSRAGRNRCVSVCSQSQSNELTAVTLASVEVPRPTARTRQIQQRHMYLSSPVRAPQGALTFSGKNPATGPNFFPIQTTQGTLASSGSSPARPGMRRRCCPTLRLRQANRTGPILQLQHVRRSALPCSRSLDAAGRAPRA